MISRFFINHGGECWLVKAQRRAPQEGWSDEQLGALREWYGAETIIRGQDGLLNFCERVEEAEVVEWFTDK